MKNKLIISLIFCGLGALCNEARASENNTDDLQLRVLAIAGGNDNDQKEIVKIAKSRGSFETMWLTNSNESVRFYGENGTYNIKLNMIPGKINFLKTGYHQITCPIEGIDPQQLNDASSQKPFSILVKESKSPDMVLVYVAADACVYNEVRVEQIEEPNGLLWKLIAIVNGKNDQELELPANLERKDLTAANDFMKIKCLSLLSGKNNYRLEVKQSNQEKGKAYEFQLDESLQLNEFPNKAFGLLFQHGKKHLYVSVTEKVSVTLHEKLKEDFTNLIPSTSAIEKFTPTRQIAGMAAFCIVALGAIIYNFDAIQAQFSHILRTLLPNFLARK